MNMDLSSHDFLFHKIIIMRNTKAKLIIYHKEYSSDVQNNIVPFPPSG